MPLAPNPPRFNLLPLSSYSGAGPAYQTGDHCDSHQKVYQKIAFFLLFDFSFFFFFCYLVKVLSLSTQIVFHEEKTSTNRVNWCASDYFDCKTIAYIFRQSFCSIYLYLILFSGFLEATRRCKAGGDPHSVI